MALGRVARRAGTAGMRRALPTSSRPLSSGSTQLRHYLSTRQLHLQLCSSTISRAALKLFDRVLDIVAKRSRMLMAAKACILSSRRVTCKKPLQVLIGSKRAIRPERCLLQRAISCNLNEITVSAIRLLKRHCSIQRF